MEDYRLEQTGQEVQDILDGAAMQTELAAETDRAAAAEQQLQGNIDAEELRAKAAEQQLQNGIDAEELRAKAAEDANAVSISNIDGKVPSAASPTNKLVDNAALQDGYYTKAAVDNLIQGLGQNDVIVGPLPTTGEANKIYRVPGDGVYSDYMWFGGAWQLLATYSANIQGYQYIGIATPSTNPGTPSNNVFYFAHEAGTYANFGALVVTQGINILKYDGTSWALEQLVGIAQGSDFDSPDAAKRAKVATVGAVLDGCDAVPTAGSVKPVQSGGVATAIQNNPYVGYFVCDTAAGTASKTVLSTNYILPTNGGGCIKIKMTYANTAASGVTLQIGSAAAKPLYYAGQVVSASNTWQDGETVEVYYDGTNYYANNLSGGGGKFATGENVRDMRIVEKISDGSTNSIPNNKAIAEITTKEINVSGSYLGKYVLDNSGDLVSNNYYTCNEYNINPASIYIITTNNKGNSSVGLFAFYGSNNELIGSVDFNAHTNYKRSIPEGAVKCRMSTYTVASSVKETRIVYSKDLDATLNTFIKKFGSLEILQNAQGSSIYITSKSSNLVDIHDLTYDYPNNGCVSTNKIYLPKDTQVVTKGIKAYNNINAIFVHYFNTDGTFISRDQIAYSDVNNQIAKFRTRTADYSYFVIVLEYNTTGTGGLTTPIVNVGDTPHEYEDCVPTVVFDGFTDNKKKVNILLDGASFSQSINYWPSKMAQLLYANLTNKSTSGANIGTTAKELFNGTLYTTEELDSYDIFIIMHVHDQNVDDESVLKANISDYTLSDLDNYSMAYDYTIRKYQSDCFNLKDNPDSRWYNSKFGKPAIIVLCTSWQDNRQTYNDSIKKLAIKFCLPLINFADNIGFSKDAVNPVTGLQWSTYYAQDLSGNYGWHPLRDNNVNGTPSYIQLRMAYIAAEVVKPWCETIRDTLI